MGGQSSRAHDDSRLADWTASETRQAPTSCCLLRTARQRKQQAGAEFIDRWLAARHSYCAFIIVVMVCCRRGAIMRPAHRNEASAALLAQRASCARARDLWRRSANQRHAQQRHYNSDRTGLQRAPLMTFAALLAARAQLLRPAWLIIASAARSWTARFQSAPLA